ncbi:protein of unknown function DUF523 [Ruminiclostridium papyrosolvens DSM 2782]|uniref:Uncharacterized protein n=1 Tax=Ruminiclostridium papyrosolvens DSM 2782 TaxID=588581 RepID=F1T8G2_9FIRM|nr:DUF523 domain-containing protein [Ruminiclostridium papyrosolvens]EGD49760.1 protein of unknown function DUF523 [Ruminiclostridium papyrosolvens DSM 2782]WES33113.1 DUF523 domain-containing protein [Ruminiclostridium papyrosolvens DSM 2782]
MILVSACLAGLDSKYNGKSNYNEYIERLVREGKAIMVCPEQMGGLPTPRDSCEIVCGVGGDVLEGKSKIIDSKGQNQTEKFLKGAEETLKVGRLYNIKKAILKSKSPSCGVGKIYDGTFSGKLTEGNGVTAELLVRNGFEVITEEEFSAK